MSDLDTHRTLVATKAYLLRNGWQKGGYGGDGAPACIIGAVGDVLSVDPCSISVSSPTYLAISNAIRWASHRLIMGVENFNDDPRTTFDEVIATLDRAIIATTPVEARVPEPVA